MRRDPSCTACGPVEDHRLDKGTAEVPHPDRLNSERGEQAGGYGDPQNTERRGGQRDDPGSTGSVQVTQRTHRDGAQDHCGYPDERDGMFAASLHLIEERGYERRAGRDEGWEDERCHDRGATDDPKDSPALVLAASEDPGHRGKPDCVQRREGEDRYLDQA